MLDYTIAQIASIVGGTISGGADPNTRVRGPVEFDSRKITEGSVFVALKGARVDGLDYARSAHEAGAVVTLAAREVNAPAIIVPHIENPDSNADAYSYDPTGDAASVIAAMSALARAVVDDCVAAGANVVAITGSAGKTSTKDIIATVLHAAVAGTAENTGAAGDKTVDPAAVIAPPGSFNNEIGLPYTALRCTPETRYLVAEMSARGIGHIHHLTTIAPPTIGVELNVGTAHLGEFGSRENIAQAKGELVEALPAGGTAILNLDDEQVAGMAARTQAQVVYYSAAGNPQAPIRATNVHLDEVARPRFTLHLPGQQPVPVKLNIFGAHQVSNALAAAAVGHTVGMSAPEIARALGDHVAASAHRMDVSTRADGVTIINDSYNANPDSMRAGLSALSYTAHGRPGATSWAVLGQMGELGDMELEAHEALADVMSDLRIDRLVAVGTAASVSAMAARARSLGVHVKHVSTTDAAVAAVNDELAPGDVVLVKASMIQHLWSVAEGLLQEGTG